MRRWLLALTGFQVADIVLTSLALRAGAHEANPLLSPVIHTPLPLLLKLALIACVWLLTTRLPQRSMRWIKFTTAIYAVVILNNLTVLALRGSA